MQYHSACTHHTNLIYGLSLGNRKRRKEIKLEARGTNEICSDVGHFYLLAAALFFFSSFDFLWKKIKIAEVLARCFFFRCTACHIDLIKMEENNKMTDDGHSCAACDHSTAVRTNTNTNTNANTNTKSERHEIIIIDILASIHFIGIAFIDLHQTDCIAKSNKSSRKLRIKYSL